MDEIKQKVQDLELALNYVCYDANLIPKLQTVWQKLELLQEVVNKKCNIPRVSGSLHYDEKLLIDLWYKRNPCHELNSNSGEDMFWKTAFMVLEDYLRRVSRNDH